MPYTVVDTEERATETSTSCKVISLKSEKQQVYVTKKKKGYKSLQSCTLLPSGWDIRLTGTVSLSALPSFNPA